MSLTPLEQKNESNLKYVFYSVLVLIFLGLGALSLVLGSQVSLIWRGLGYSVLLTGLFLGFLQRNIKLAMFAMIVFTSTFEAPMRYLTDQKIETIASYLGRDLIIYLTAIGFILYAFVTQRKQKNLDIPPFITLILFFCLNLFIQFFNFNSSSPIASFINARIFWEMIPVYFLGYFFMRELKTWRILFITFVAITALNGAVGYYQTLVGPDVVSKWGPGYYNNIIVNDRTYLVKKSDSDEFDFENKRIRPLGLGPDGGFPGSLGVFAIPISLAFIALNTLEKEKFKDALKDKSRIIVKRVAADLFNILIPYLAFAATILAIFVSDSRSSFAIGGIAFFISLLFINPGGSRSRSIITAAALVTVLFIGYQGVQLLNPKAGARVGDGTPLAIIDAFVREGRQAQIIDFPIFYILNIPLGAGLDNLGPAAGFVGSLVGIYVRPQNLNVENNINLTLVGLGVPGLVVWLTIHFGFFLRSWRIFGIVQDKELKIYIAAGMGILAITFINWPFGNLISFPQNMFFWLIPGMIFGSFEDYKKRVLEESKES